MRERTPITTLEAHAEALREAQATQTPCAPPTERTPSLSVADAYEIQRINIRRRQREHGARVVGHKVGLTSHAIQEWLKVDQPDFGVLLDEMMVPASGSFGIERLLQPRAEAEIAFVLGEDLQGPGLTTADIINATAYVLPAIEVIGSRIADWKITYEDTIADNASSGLFVLGTTPRKLEGLDLSLAGMKLSKNGRVVSTGAGAACLDHPIHAVQWLANTFGRLGTKLRAGEVILSGALGPVTELAPGDVLHAEISGLGHVHVRVDAPAGGDA